MENIELKYLKNIVDSAFNGDNNDLEMSLISMLKILKKTENNKNKNYIEDINEILKKHQSGLVKKIKTLLEISMHMITKKKANFTLI